ncbi:MAG: bifunctional 5,10-methylenetetrahydrofolate dehydrogenase/5,10-methenyltetrahydrofolate cyclohydrolase [Alphaproteobacteria bacterium]|nr:bifunctional 5,10-methylenetetrahydrofolate dehydrogenase/5,10-methenyltetrahydrofolate cyclohydrolase [Alphaproteobacteria bacterium]
MNTKSHKLIDGAQQARLLKDSLIPRIAALKDIGITPTLAAILVGDNPSSHVYVNSKCRQSEEIGIKPRPHFLPANTAAATLFDLIKTLNQDPTVHGILLQLPLPAHLEARPFIEAIAPHKDVDGLTLENAGRLATGADGVLPCTPKGCLKLIKTVIPDTAGLHAAVVGRSLLVGSPMAQLLLHKADCSVSIVHNLSLAPERLCRQADILVVAAGVPGLITPEWVKEGAVVIDVGITQIEKEDGTKTLAGDVAFDAVLPRVRAITPVPGGVGPMTVACLLENTVELAETFGTLRRERRLPPFSS